MLTLPYVITKYLKEMCAYKKTLKSPEGPAKTREESLSHDFNYQVAYTTTQWG